MLNKILPKFSVEEIKSAIDNSPKADIIYREIGRAVVAGLVSAASKAGINIISSLSELVISNLKTKI